MPYIGQPPSTVISGSDIIDGTVDTADLAANAVTTVKIADLNVTEGKIADLNVTESKIADLNVTESKIASGAVTLTKAADTIIAYDFGLNAGFDGDNLPTALTANTIYAEFILGRNVTVEEAVGYIDTPGISIGANTNTVTIDLEQNGTSIYSVKPYFANNTNTLTTGTLSTTNLSSGDRLTFRVTDVGTNTAGAGARVTFKARQR